MKIKCGHAPCPIENCISCKQEDADRRKLELWDEMLWVLKMVIAKMDDAGPGAANTYFDNDGEKRLRDIVAKAALEENK